MQEEQQAQSFAERKAAQLREERTIQEASQPPAEAAPGQQETSDETPPPESESVQSDGYPELHDEQAESEDEALEDEDLDDEIPSDEPEDEEEGERVNWEQRYKDTQAELTRVAQRRKELDAEHAESVSANLQLKYDLEDRLTKAEEQANFFLNGINSQIGQLEQAFNSGAVEPEKMQEARGYYQNLVGQRTQLQTYLDKAGEQRGEAERVRKQREAEITRSRLSVSIPDWSQDKYDEMRGYATQRGYSPDEFNEITDYRYFELLHDSMLLNSAEKTVRNVKSQRRRKAPRGGKNVDRSPNTARRREARARKDFLDNPNQKGRFAAMKAEELSRERRR